MMQIVGIGLISTILILLVKEQKPLFAYLLTIFAGIFIFVLLADKMVEVFSVLERLAEHSGVNTAFMKTIMKIIGIAYIAEFGAQIMRDAGQESIASKIELSGKILIMVMAIPIISVIIDTVMKLMPA